MNAIDPLQAAGPAGSACARVRARLPEHLDGELSALEAARDSGHLEACPGCVREARAWMQLEACIAHGVPEDLTFASHGLEERLASARMPAGRKGWIASPELRAGLLAAAAMLVLTGLQWLTPEGVDVGSALEHGSGGLAALELPVTKLQGALSEFLERS